MSESENATTESPDAFYINKNVTGPDGKIVEMRFTLEWGTIGRGDNKGEKTPVVGENHGLQDYLLLLGEEQALNILASKVRQQCLTWGQTAIEPCDGTWTDKARETFSQLFKEGRITRLTKSEIEDQLAKIMPTFLGLAGRLATDAVPEFEQPKAKAELARLITEINNLKALKDAVSRKRKKNNEEEEDED